MDGFWLVASFGGCSGFDWFWVRWVSVRAFAVRWVLGGKSWFCAVFGDPVVLSVSADLLGGLGSCGLV